MDFRVGLDILKKTELPSPAGIANSDSPTNSLVTISTELPQLMTHMWHDKSSRHIFVTSFVTNAKNIFKRSPFLKKEFTVKFNLSTGLGRFRFLLRCGGIRNKSEKCCLLYTCFNYQLNTFAASYLNTQGLNNSCWKPPASTLVDLTFQSRALRSFSLNQLRNLSL